MNDNKPIMIKEAARLLNVGSGKLFKLLKDEGAIGKLNNLPRKDLVDQGYFEVDIRSYRKAKDDNSHGIRHQYTVTLVTPKGLTYISSILEEHPEVCH